MDPETGEPSNLSVPYDDDDNDTEDCEYSWAGVFSLGTLLRLAKPRVVEETDDYYKYAFAIHMEWGEDFYLFEDIIRATRRRVADIPFKITLSRIIVFSTTFDGDSDVDVLSANNLLPSVFVIVATMLRFM